MYEVLAKVSTQAIPTVNRPAGMFLTDRLWLQWIADGERQPAVAKTDDSIPIDAAVELYGDFSLPVLLETTPENAFDVPSSVSVTFSDSSGALSSVQPFYFQNYTRHQLKNGSEVLTARSQPQFLVRFTPSKHGVYTFTLHGATTASGATSGTLRVATGRRDSVAGFASVAPGQQFFRAGDSSPLFLLGENIPFPGPDPILTTYNYTNLYPAAHAGTYMYDQYLTKMAASGGNYVRLWVGLSCLPPKNTPLSLAGGAGAKFGSYSLEAAWRIDHILSLGKRLGIYVLICFEAQQSLEMLFNTSIYSEVNGGPLQTPAEYFKSGAIQGEFKQRLRYSASRFGHSTAVFAWQMYNEHGNFPSFVESQQVDWIANLSSMLKQYDAHGHLIHDSYGGLPLAGFAPSIDFATIHNYGSADFAAEALNTLPGLQRQWEKPVFWGETALSGNGIQDASQWWKDDLTSVHLHNSLWGSAVSTAAGGAMHWWWHEFDDHNAYTHFLPVRKFMDRLPLLQRSWSHMPVVHSNGTLPHRSCSLPARAGHFPAGQGSVVANFAGGDPASCQQHCCRNEKCTGWIFTTSQIISARAPCKLGEPCCWLKTDVETISPLANCTAGFMQTSNRPGSWEVLGGAMLGHSNSHNDTAAIWMHNARHTWQTQRSAPAMQRVGPVNLSLPGFGPGREVVLSLIDSYTGAITSNQSLKVGSDGRLALQFEPFVHDVAAIVTSGSINGAARWKSDDDETQPLTPVDVSVPSAATYEVYNPIVTHSWVVESGTSDLKYNHDSSIAQFDSVWITVWNANVLHLEARPGQINYMATSSDRQTWSTPEPAFSGPASSNPVVYNSTCMQWQPNLVLIKGGTQLGCAWSQGWSQSTEVDGCFADVTYWSVLDSSPQNGGRWLNRQLTFDGGSAHGKLINGGSWQIFPTQNPIFLRSGRLLVPVTLEQSSPMARRAAVLISDDQGANFELSNGTWPADHLQGQWETTVWEPTDSKNSTEVWLFDRNNSGTPSLPPDQRLLYARSTDAGESWTSLQAVHANAVVARMLVTPLAGDLFMMVHNDWTSFNDTTGGDCNRCDDRVNTAMWFNRGGGINFVQGPGFAVGETGSVYPQTFVDLKRSQASIVYTAASPYGIRLAVVHPLPTPSHRYVYPRTNMPSLFSGAPLLNDGIATFKNTNGWLHSTSNASLGSTFSLGMWVQPSCNPDSICMLADTRGTDGRGVLLGLLPSPAHRNCTSVSREQRSDCGETGIDEPTCVARGCCYEKPYISGPQCYTAPQNTSDAMQVYFFPAPGSPGSNLPSFEIQLGIWSFIGASVACPSTQKDDVPQNCSVQFFVNGKSSDQHNLLRPRSGEFGGGILKLARFIGSFRAVATFAGQDLSLAEHNAWANLYTNDLSLPPFSPVSAVPTPQLLLDPANVKNMIFWQSSAPPAADAVHTVDSGRILQLCGQGSAGVDIPFLSGGRGEMLHADFRFKLSAWSTGYESGQLKSVGQVIVLTVGDSRHPLRIVVDNGQVYATMPNIGNVLLGPSSTSNWQVLNLTLSTATGEATVSLDGAYTTLTLGAIQSVWMYLGQGYRTNATDTYSRAQCAEIDLTSMDTSVHNSDDHRSMKTDTSVKTDDTAVVAAAVNVTFSTLTKVSTQALPTTTVPWVCLRACLCLQVGEQWDNGEWGKLDPNGKEIPDTCLAKTCTRDTAGVTLISSPRESPVLLVLAPDDSGAVVICTANDTVQTSTDGGRHWKRYPGPTVGIPPHVPGPKFAANRPFLDIQVIDAYPLGCSMKNLTDCVPVTSFKAASNKTYYDWSLTPMGAPDLRITHGRDVVPIWKGLPWPAAMLCTSCGGGAQLTDGSYIYLGAILY